MGKELKGITAKEARKLADESDFTLRHIYKAIRERAEENGISLEWCIYGISKGALDLIKTRLNEDGFKTEIADDSLTIKW